MKITSAEFIKSIPGDDELLENDIPQIALIGRSNVGKSSVINSLVNKKGLAKTSSTPGSTQMINLFFVNRTFYLVDLPGYGFVKGAKEKEGRLQQVIQWYLFDSTYVQKKVVLIIDAEVGPTKADLHMLYSLQERQKDIVIVANKIDKVKKSKYASSLQEIQRAAGDYKVIPYSAEKKIGVGALSNELFGQ